MKFKWLSKLFARRSNQPNSLDSYPNLPDEIWFEIFSYLLADDRGNIRLTSRRFYKLCNEMRLLMNEEMVFHGDLNTSSALQSLSSSRKPIPNIRFNRVRIMDTFLPFFRARGGGIHSLILYRCIFGPGLFRGIVKHCKNLRSIDLVLRFDERNQFFQNVIDDVRELSKKSRTFDRVIRFKLQIDRDVRDVFKEYPEDVVPTPWTNRTFLQFVALFPNVKALDLEFEVELSFEHSNTITADITSDTQFTLSSIYDRLQALKNQLEHLRLYINFIGLPHLPPETLENITRIEFNNLKELSLNFEDLSDSFASNRYLVFQNVTHISCYFLYYQRRPPSTALQLLLRTVPGLRSLVFHGTNICVSKPCFEALVGSQLTRFEITRNVEAFFELSSIEATLKPNYSLKQLSIEATRNESNKCAQLFTSYFRSLERFVLNNVDEDTSFNIFKYQNSLRTLKLHRPDFERSSDENRTRNYDKYRQVLKNDALSQHRLLPHMTHLDIDNVGVGLAAFLLGEFKFPQLKSLTVRINDEEIIHEQLWNVLSTMTQLQFLAIHFAVVTTNFCEQSRKLVQSIPAVKSRILCKQALTLVRSLPNLRHICLRDNEDRSCFDNSEYLQLYEGHLSLRTVIHNGTKYFYDITTKTAHKIYQSIGTVEDGGHPWDCEGIPHHYARDNRCW